MRCERPIAELTDDDLPFWVAPDGQAPTVFQANGLLATGSVRLFNRCTLVERLQCDGVTLPEETADGDMLLHLYVRYGIHGFAFANGMFAFAILDGDDVLLVRDHVGTRTLFYTYFRQRWFASSSLRALRSLLDGHARLNVNAVVHF
ncbi:hypothetical protein [Chloroflexus sp.]|uniref:hypothetical protein n=1 Tax=Chloroflexus sp. TaxID=1904827 RepID=UPI00404AE28A